MSDDILNYRFLVPIDEDTENFFKKTFPNQWNTSDGSPFCKIDKGLLFNRNHIENLPKKCKYNIYEISDRFLDTKDFISAFWDGDVEDDDFIFEEVN